MFESEMFILELLVATLDRQALFICNFGLLDSPRKKLLPPTHQKLAALPSPSKGVPKSLFFKMASV